MSTWTGTPESAPVLDAARLWRERCLAGNGSVFSDRPLWTADNFRRLKELFVDKPLEGDEPFYAKLERQIGNAEPSVIQLAAEAVWLLLLFAHSDAMRPKTKRERVTEIWGLSDGDVAGGPLLQEPALRGLGNPGTAFLTHIPLELRYLILLFLKLKSLPDDEQRSLLSPDPWRFCEFATSIEKEDSARAFRHMVLYLIYPDSFERICSRKHKQTIYETFSSILAPSVDAYARTPSPCALDKALLAIRKKLEEEQGTAQLDFYLEPLRSRWHPKAKSDDDAQKSDPDEEPAPKPATRRYWIEKTAIRGRPDREGGPHRLGVALWSPQRRADGNDIYANMREVRPGDVVFHLTDNEAITGTSIAAAAVDDTFGGIDGTTWGMQPSYRVELRDFRPLEPPFTREMFFDDIDTARQLKAIMATDRGRGLFFNKDLELNQGGYLTEAPPRLMAVLAAAYEKATQHTLPYLGEAPAIAMRAAKPARQPFSLDAALEGVFLDKVGIERMLSIWRAKKNLILQGPPGVGKSFLARTLAYGLVGYTAPELVDFVQFHQSYSYEDFVQGYRPTPAGFALRNGRLYQFCERARQEPSVKHVFIIDEINRGNLSKILGELMLLIEADKRKPEWALALAYADGSNKFYIPENVYFLGLMNTADRSLAVVDYALRRRFAFVDLKPQFESERFATHLHSLGISNPLIGAIRQRVGDLNRRIEEDTSSLGRGFVVGHSFFCARDDKAASENQWYRQIVETEIVPLLEEYWFDNPKRVAEERERLLEGF